MYPHDQNCKVWSVSSVVFWKCLCYQKLASNFWCKKPVQVSGARFCSMCLCYNWPSGTEADDEVLCIDAEWLLVLPSDGARRWPWHESTVLTPGDCTEYRLHSIIHRQNHQYQHHCVNTGTGRLRPIYYDQSINQSINHKSLCSMATSRLEVLHNAVWQSRGEIRWWDLDTTGWRAMTWGTCLRNLCKE